MIWMISANGKMYDHAAAFQKWGFIDWRQRARYTVGDIVYIYCTKPLKKVMYKTVVQKVDMLSSDIVSDQEFWHDITEYYKSLDGKYSRLKLLEQVDNNALSLDHLLQHGLKAAPQGPVKVNEELSSYIEKYMDDYDVPGIFPESDLSEVLYEGAKTKVEVNKYERSSIARKKCIEYNGLDCTICGLNFEKKYGDVGKDFIHIHHLKPLNEIGKEYIIDYKKDLIPVCPNCHAMLHRKVNGKAYSIEELKDIVRR